MLRSTKIYIPALLLCVLQAGIAPVVTAQIAPFNFRHLTNNEGLHDGIVRAIVQDKYGFIWIGTSYGLNRFDGINVKNFFSSRGLPGTLKDSYITSLYLDSRGNLWVGTLKGLNRYDYPKNSFISFDSKKDVIINDMHEDRKGKLWLGTND